MNADVYALAGEPGLVWVYPTSSHPPEDQGGAPNARRARGGQMPPRRTYGWVGQQMPNANDLRRRRDELTLALLGAL